MFPIPPEELLDADELFEVSSALELKLSGGARGAESDHLHDPSALLV
jgi:hypothetical protein